MQLDMADSRPAADNAPISQSQMAHHPREESAEPAAAIPPSGGLHHRLRRPLLIAVPVLMALAGGAAYLADKPYVSTDDAYVRSTKGSINARVSGQVVEIAVRDNQFVRKGQLLFRIDPAP